MRKKIFSNNQVQDIIYKYQEEYLGMEKIGKLYHVSKGVIKRVLKENNIQIRQDNHTYYADYTKFQEIDSPEKAYWLGFIAADGCVYTRKQNATIRVAIHQKDIEHLVKLKKFMNSNVKISTFISNAGFSSNTPMCCIVFNSKTMAQNLINVGVVPNKSLILEPPNIEEKYYLPYILGYFDGDGTIYKNKNGEYTIGFVGTLSMINWINNVLQLNARLEQRVQGSLTYSIRCGGIKKPYTYLKQLYESTEIHLERKFLIFQELENVVLSRNTK